MSGIDKEHITEDPVFVPVSIKGIRVLKRTRNDFQAYLFGYHIQIKYALGSYFLKTISPDQQVRLDAFSEAMTMEEAVALAVRSIFS
jgi:hypothetical protein